MKRIILIAIVSICFLGSGIYLCSYLKIQNVFDEMYYGYYAISPFCITRASYDNFGLQDIPNSMRNMVDGEIIEYLESDLLNNGETLSFEWMLGEKQLKFMYISPSKNKKFNYVFNIIYSLKDHVLIYLPLRISSNNDTPVEDINSFLIADGVTRTSIEEFLQINFLKKLTTRWTSVNKQKSRFTSDNIGNIDLKNYLWYDFKK